MPLGLSSDRVAVEPYDPEWPLLFEEERRRILGTVGHIVAGVHHVGSTAIPGMPSKPLLDIAVLLREFEDGERCIAPLERIGYVHRGLLDDIPGDRSFRKGDDPPEGCSDSEGAGRMWRTHHIHMYTLDSPIWHNQVRFRDYLIAQPELAAKYARLKLTLAHKHPNDRESYRAGKDPFIAEVLAKAAEELG